MHSSKEQQQKQDPAAYGSEIADFLLSSLFGPVVHMAVETAQVASALYEDRFEAAARTDNRTNGQNYALGVKHSLGGSFSRAITADNTNDFDLKLPFWKRDAEPRPRLAA